MPKFGAKLNLFFKPTNFLFLYFFSQLMSPPSTHWPKPEIWVIWAFSLPLMHHHTKFCRVSPNIFWTWPLLYSYHQCFHSSFHDFSLNLQQLSPNWSDTSHASFIAISYTAAKMMYLEHKTDHVNFQLKFQWFLTALMKPRFLSMTLMIPKHTSILVLTKFN